MSLAPVSNAWPRNYVVMSAIGHNEVLQFAATAPHGFRVVSIPAMSEDQRKPSDTEEKKTIELCAEQHEGHRCILRLGHDGPHECHTAMSVLRWAARRK